MNAHQIVEAVLFASDAPLTADEIARADESLDEDKVEQAIRFLKDEYDDAERSFQIAEVAEGYQVLTRSEFAPYLERFDNVPRPSRLSGPALETLSIIAYRQPMGRIEIEYVRGVGSAGVLKTLVDREMIDVVGRADALGRPVLYGTTQRFLEHFGFKSLEDLPRPEELPVILRERIPLGPEEEAAPDESEQLVLGEGEGAPAEAGEATDPDGEEDAEATAEAGEVAEQPEDVTDAPVEIVDEPEAVADEQDHVSDEPAEAAPSEASEDEDVESAESPEATWDEDAVLEPEAPASEAHALEPEAPAADGEEDDVRGPTGE